MNFTNLAYKASGAVNRSTELDNGHFVSMSGLVERTVAHTPKQNGVAERSNHTLIEKVHTMLLNSGMPKLMWSEPALTTVVSLNRIPTAALSYDSDHTK